MVAKFKDRAKKLLIMNSPTIYKYCRKQNHMKIVFVRLDVRSHLHVLDIEYVLWCKTDVYMYLYGT